MSRFFPEYALNEKNYPKRYVDNVKLDGSVKCICCSKSIEPLLPDETYQHRCRECGHEELNKTEEIQNVGCKDAITAKISAGYGSDYDTSYFLIAICDDCLEQALQAGRARYAGRYM